MARPGNTLAVSVLDTLNTADADILNGEVLITGIPPIKWRDIVDYRLIPDSVGALQVSTINYGVSPLVPVVGTAYKIVIRPNFPDGLAELAEPRSETYIVVASTAVLADLTIALTAAINANTQSKFTSTSTVTTVVINQRDFTIEGFTVTLATNSDAIATGTPYVAPAGTAAIVAANVPPSTTVGGAAYDTYIISIDQRKYFDSAGDVTAEKLQAIVYANIAGTGSYANFTAAMLAIFDGSNGAPVLGTAEYNAFV